MNNRDLQEGAVGWESQTCHPADQLADNTNSNDTKVVHSNNNNGHPFIHGNHTCDMCLTTPIVGIRWHAINLADYDICDACKENLNRNDIAFEAVELDSDRPLQEFWIHHMFGKSPFQKWQEEHETMQRDGAKKTTLEQQIELALQLWNGATGETEATVTATQVQGIVEALQKTPVCDTECIVSWSGFRVGWFLDVFCKMPYVQTLLEFGCELWFVRKVCIVVIIQQAHCAVDGENNKNDIVPILSGPFVNFVDMVVLGLGLESSATEIVRAPTTFVSYTGGYTMQETIDMLCQLDPNEIVWMDVFCVNQFAWTGKSRSPEMKLFKNTFLGNLEKQIQTIDNTVLILQDWKNVMATLGQIWVLWEIFCTAETGSRLEIVLPPAQAHDFVQNCLESNEDFDDIMASLASIDARLARAEEGGDQQAIFDLMKEAGLSKANNMASSAVRGWLYQIGQEYLEEKRRDEDGPSPSLLNNLAGLLRAQGRLQEAEPLYVEVLEKCEKVLGRNHPDTLTSLNNLALLLKSQGKLEEAEPLYREVLEKSVELVGRDNPDTLVSINNLAMLLESQGKLEEAEPLYRESLGKRQKLLGPNHPDTLVSANNLALLLKNQGKLQEAEILCRETLKKREKLLGRNHPDTLTSLNGLALLLTSQGKLEEAEPLYREALEKSEKLLGRDNPDTLASINNLVSLLHAQGKMDEAEPVSREALEKSQKLLGCIHPDTLISLNNLALLLRDQGKLEEAEPLHAEVLEKYEKVLGRNHPDTLTSLNNLALLLKSQGRLEEAEPLYREALEKSEKLLGRNHPDTLVSINNLASLLHALGKMDEAEPMSRGALEMSQKILGCNHAVTLTSLNNLALLLKSQGKLEEAEPLYREALEKRLLLVGSDHPDTLVSINNLAMLLESQGKLEEAEPLYWEALKKRQKVLGHDHPDTLTSKNNLAFLLESQGKLEEA